MERYVRPSVASDVAYIADHMRAKDIEEVEACGHTAYQALALGLDRSDPCYTLQDFEGTPIAMCGVTPSWVQGSGMIWMLGTPGIEECRITFLKYSRPALEMLYEQSGCDLLFNYTYAENTVHHEWLKWLGFSFLRKVEMPPQGRHFYEFARLRS